MLPGPFTPDRPPTPTQRVEIYCRPISLPFPAANRYHDSYQIRALENTFTNHQVGARVDQCRNRLGRCVWFRRLWCGGDWVRISDRRAGAERAQLCVLAMSSIRTDRRALLCASLPGGAEEIGGGSRKGGGAGSAESLGLGLCGLFSVCTARLVRGISKRCMFIK